MPAAPAAVAEAEASESVQVSSVEASRHLARAEQLAEEAWQCLTDSSWQVSLDKQNVQVLCRSSRWRSRGRAWRLETSVPLPASRLFVEMWDNVHLHPQWNSNIVFSRVVARVDDVTSILHNATAEAAGGIVKARDFVTLRVRRERDGVLFTGGVSVASDAAPVAKGFVRGHNFPGCIACVPLGPSACRLVWTMDSDIKGWMPAAIVDQAMTSVIFQLGLSIQQLAAGILQQQREDGDE